MNSPTFYLEFEASGEEFAAFEVAMPESWDEGTITFTPVWKEWPEIIE